jgi:GT2 family glycosyltransferase
MLREKPATHKYLNCDIFSQNNEIDKETISEVNKLSVEFEQDELSVVLSDMDKYPRVFDYVHILKSNSVGNYPFSSKKTKYSVTYHNLKNIDPDKPGLLLPIKDTVNLLEFTLQNLSDMNVGDYANITIIDDRSEDADKIKQLANRHGAVYIRVDYPSDVFNFSMLNNLGAFLYHRLGHEDIILWNADLWTPDKKSVPKLLKIHKQSKKKGFRITGTKLLYPESGFCHLVNENRTYQELAKDFQTPEEFVRDRGVFGNTQYGGGTFATTIEFLTNAAHTFMSPVHYGRFLERDNPQVNINRETNFITGAFQIIDLNTFVELGGFCPTLSCSYQDTDLCLRISKSGHKVQYVGENVYLFHAESLVLSSKLDDSKESLKHSHSNTRDKLISDEIIYSMLWNYYFLSGQMKL